MTRLPRLRAAVVAGTGAGGSLGAAALCILALGTASVSFVSEGSPDLREPAPVARLADPPPRPDPAPQSVPSRARVTAPATAPAVRVTGGRPRRAAARTRRAAVVTEQRSSRPVIRTAPSRPPAPAPPAPPPPEPTILRGHLQTAAGHARQTGETVAATASQVSPQAGELVRQTTGTAADLVDDVAELVP